MKATTHESIFSYNITKPYPYKWFTPVVLVSLVAFTVLFSFVNFVSNGFTLINESSGNPNSTASESHWFQHWPSFLTGKFQSTCEPFNLQVNSELFTNQTALTYTVTDIWQPALNPQNVTNTYAPSLPYYNNVLEDCSVWSIEMDLEALDRSANQIAYAEWGATVRSYVTCAIQGPNATTMLNLTQEYDYVPPSISFGAESAFLGTNFIERDRQSRASLWWGESLLSTYWGSLSWQMQLIRENDTEIGQPGIRKGSMSFTRTEEARGDITDLNFFQVDYRFIIDTVDPPGAFTVVFPGSYSPSNFTAGTRTSFLAAQSAYPNIWPQADALAKSAYSTILADLGQVNAIPNILTNASAL